MDYVEKLNIRDVLYLIHDLELRNSINKVSIEDDDDQLVAANVLYSRIGWLDNYVETLHNDKTDIQLFVDFVNNALSKVATTGKYADLLEKPDPYAVCPTVEGTALVFRSSSEGLSEIESQELEHILGSESSSEGTAVTPNELILLNDIIGSGDINE